MFEFFDFIVNIIKTIFNPFIHAVETFQFFVKHMTDGYLFVSMAISSLPPFCQGALLCIVAISILSMLLSFFVDNA